MCELHTLLLAIVQEYTYIHHAPMIIHAAAFLPPPPQHLLRCIAASLGAPLAQHTSTASGGKCSTQRCAVLAMCADGTASSSSVESRTMPAKSVVALSCFGQLWPGSLLLLVCCVLISSATCLQDNTPAAVGHE